MTCRLHKMIRMSERGRIVCHQRESCVIKIHTRGMMLVLINCWSKDRLVENQENLVLRLSHTFTVPTQNPFLSAQSSWFQAVSCACVSAKRVCSSICAHEMPDERLSWMQQLVCWVRLIVFNWCFITAPHKMRSCNTKAIRLCPCTWFALFVILFLVVDTWLS